MGLIIQIRLFAQGVLVVNSISHLVILPFLVVITINPIPGKAPQIDAARRIFST